MRENGGNTPYTNPTWKVDVRVSELTAAAETNAEEGSSAKKSYTKPTLTIYGTIRDLTKMVGVDGPMDGGNPSSGMFKTQI
jgi:hypothetical protein